MSTPWVVTAFYEQIWNAGVLDAAARVLTVDFRFRGSLGSELQGQPAFLDYVRSVRAALAEYRCEIVACVAEEERAFARMRFSGRHVGPLLGHAATGKLVQWEGAALFEFRGGAIATLWVLGDLAGLKSMLEANASP